MLRVDHNHSAAPSLLGALDRGLDLAGSVRGLGRYLMPQLKVNGLAQAISPLVPGNAELADSLYRNRFALGGTEVSAGTGSVFALPAPSEEWAVELHGFAWVLNLAAGGLEMHRAFARSLIMDWVSRRRPRIARALPVRAARLKACVLAAPFLLAGASASFRTAFYRTLGRDLSVLAVASPRAADRMQTALALAYAATSLAGAEGLRAGAFERLEAVLTAEILPDGGHRSRNPARLVGLLIDLLPLRSALAASHQVIPRTFNGAIERMLPMLRFFVHGDDGLAAFQGVTSPLTREVRAVLGTDSTLGRPLSHAPHSGYARLSQGTSLVIADIGHDGVCSSPLAFEFSDGPSRIVVNCGLPCSASESWFSAARQDVAHSTATLDASGPFCGPFSWFRKSPGLPKPRAMGRVSQSEHGPLLRAIDHAFGGRRANQHERDIFLSGDGDDLRGEDRFLTDDTACDGAATVRFHLHPSVKATLSQDRASVMLILANRSGWRFSARGGEMSLEESVFLMGSAAPRKTQQIVLRSRERVHWAFKRIERTKRPRGESDAPELPL
jgi:uncharacterized heparinase superfamily protein